MKILYFVARRYEKILHLLYYVTENAERSEIFKLLVSLGADVCHRDVHGNCPILSATRYGCAESLRICIENGADLNVKSNFDGNTPMHRASNCHAEMVKILYDNGALLTIKNHDGETPMEYGLKNDDDDLYSTKSFAFLQH